MCLCWRRRRARAFQCFFSFRQLFSPASSPCELVGSRAGFIYISDISFPSLKIIYNISAIIGLRRRHTTTFSINIEGLNGVFMFPSTFSFASSQSDAAPGEHEIVFTG